MPNATVVSSEKNHVLVKGDLLCKLLNTYDIHSADELPRSINGIWVEYLQVETKITAIADDYFLMNMVPLNNVILFLLLMGD